MASNAAVYIDYRSPFAYLAKNELYALEREFALTFEWLPFALDLQGAYGGEVEERTERHWRKVRYLYMDARRLANRQGLIVRGTQKIYDPTLAHIAMLHAKAEGFFRPWHDSVLERFWRREFDIEDKAVLCAAIAELGHDPAAFERYLAGPGPEEYSAIVAAAEARGVFGVPTVIIDDELFWGTDRLWMVRERLEAKRAKTG
jgi:2-hydroxychromene-2-carboxylate isomerase